jgi:hypothetical protein
MRKEALESEIEIMEKEIVYLKGKRRELAKKKYRKLILPQLKDPIYLKRK